MLLPNPDKYNPNPQPVLTKDSTVFFENPMLDSMAKHFIGNNTR